MFEKMVITKLFGTFDYTIPFKSKGLTIFTGPNGYGKTTILRILDAVSSKNPFFFFNLLFDEITINLSDGLKIFIKSTDFGFSLSINDEDSSKYNKADIFSKVEDLLDDGPFRRIEKNVWIDRRSEKVYTLDDLINDPFFSHNADISIREIQMVLPPMPKVYRISEQRLLRRTSNYRTMRYYHDSIGMEGNPFGETIEQYASDLSDRITNTQASSSKVGQDLDSSFPRRLFDQDEEISQVEFEHRFSKVQEIQKALGKFGLSTTKDDNHPTYKQEHSKSLFVYLNDTEKKLEVFGKLLVKLEIFTNILNERRFAFKKINISPEKGFKFITTNGRPLNLKDLSSGEKQEVVLLYELLFKVEPNTLVLIDEPEISLHVAWQKEFLSDLLRVIELQHISVITATHSPQIINNNWDLTVDLEELSR